MKRIPAEILAITGVKPNLFFFRIYQANDIKKKEKEKSSFLLASFLWSLSQQNYCDCYYYYYGNSYNC